MPSDSIERGRQQVALAGSFRGPHISNARGLMKTFLGLWLLLATIPVLAVERPVPAEFVGEWVPVGSSCDANSRLRVESKSVSLVNGPDSQQFGNLDICFSCEGGARYNGMVVWLLPEFNHGARTPFTVRFNANEEKGITVITIERDDLKKRFPLHNVKLLKCQSKT
jgi:hypothetical protein